MFTHEKFPKKAVAVSGGLLTLCIAAGCAQETPAETPGSNITSADLSGAAITTVTPGKSAYVAITDPQSAVGQRLLALSPAWVNHIYPHGPTDAMAPKVTQVPTRFHTQVTLSGARSNYLDNDAACDIYNVSSSAPSIGVIALGGGKNDVFVNWPTEQGETVNQVEVCMFQDNEPGKGVIMFAR